MSPRHWRIGVRLTVGFGVLIALMLAMVVVGVVRVSSLLEANRLIIEREWSKAEAANTLSSIAQANARRTIEIYFAENEAERAQKRSEIVAGRETFVQAFKTLQTMVYVPEAKTWLAEAEEARGRYVTSQARFNQLVDAGDKEAAFAELHGQTLPQLVIVQDRVDRLARLQRLDQAAAASDGERMRKEAHDLGGTVGSFGLQRLGELVVGPFRAGALDDGGVVGVDDDLLVRAQRIVRADLLNASAVACETGVRHHDAVKGVLLGAHSSQSDFYCHCSFTSHKL